jgi:hypothetical protein
MSLREGYHMREEDGFPVTHSVEYLERDQTLTARRGLKIY